MGSSSSSGGIIEICNDFEDNDFDGAPDCMDLDCQGTPVCIPGNGVVGTPCTVATQCQATGGDPLCLAQDADARPNGYCSEFCDAFTGTGCTGTGVCLTVDQQASLALCFAPCDPLNAGSCRAGYSCATVGANSVCVDAEDGPVGCADLGDNDLDGLMDCQDPGCQALAQCQPGAQAAGTACTTSSQCNAVGNDPLCITETVVGWPSGSCSEFCDPAQGQTGNPGCQSGANCIAFNNGQNGLCLPPCTTSATCRTGYACDQGQGVCLPSCTGATDCPTVGYCEQTPTSPDLGLCQQPVCGDGVREGPEQCDPPGAGCSANCLAVELSCDNFQDDDNDNLQDCLDPDCAAVCTPGATPTGGTCNAASDCVATGNDPVCVPAAFWPGSYCTERCVLSTNSGCTGTAHCVDFDNGQDPNGYCLATCTQRSDCRPGYECGFFNDGAGATVRGCIPAEANCNNLQDDDADGTVDCGDSDCAADLECVVGNGAAGTACVSSSECSAVTGNDPACLGEQALGWPGGTCSEWCNPLTSGQCPTGFGCAPVSATNGVCLQDCLVNNMCRAGYACAPWDGAPPTASFCQPACTADAQCTFTGTCANPASPTAGLCVFSSCGDNLREGTEECDGTDTTAGSTCNFLCRLVPNAWTCDPNDYNTVNGCQCGCGVVDVDCADATLFSCDQCDSLGSCGSPNCDNINMNNNAVCL